MDWKKTIKVKHLLTEKEDHESIQDSMNKIADVLETYDAFFYLPFKKFRNIPKDNDIFSPCEIANKLLSIMYQVADDNRIWIE